jgi:CelD/BcsL family acetyltransferase involved in cellulose biosynthesis
VLDLLPTEGAVADALEGALSLAGTRRTWFERRTRPVVLRRAQESYLDGRVSARRRKTWRRLRRRLAEELGAEPVAVDQAATGGLDQAIQTFLRVEASGWKGREGGAFSCRPAHAAFFRQLCHGFAREGRLQLWTLGTADRWVAAQCNLVAGDTVFHMKIAYDERFARFSPGVQLELEMLSAFHADAGLRMLDSCTATTGTVSDLLYPDRRALGTLLLPLSGPLGHAATRSTPALASAYRRIRHRPTPHVQADELRT